MPIEPKSDLPDAEKREFIVTVTPAEEALIKARILVTFYRLRAAKLFQALKNRLWVA